MEVLRPTSSLKTNISKTNGPLRLETVYPTVWWGRLGFVCSEAAGGHPSYKPCAYKPGPWKSYESKSQLIVWVMSHEAKKCIRFGIVRYRKLLRIVDVQKADMAWLLCNDSGCLACEMSPSCCLAWMGAARQPTFRRLSRELQCHNTRVQSESSSLNQLLLLLEGKRHTYL